LCLCGQMLNYSGNVYDCKVNRGIPTNYKHFIYSVRCEVGLDVSVNVMLWMTSQYMLCC